MKEQPPRFLDELEPPGPHPDLRKVVLAATSAALAQPPCYDRWTAVWESRPAKLAWIISVVSLVAGHLLLPLGPGEPGKAIARTPTATREDAAYNAFVGLSPWRLDARPLIGSAAAGADDLAVALDGATETKHGKEDKS